MEEEEERRKRQLETAKAETAAATKKGKTLNSISSFVILTWSAYLAYLKEEEERMKSRTLQGNSSGDVSPPGVNKPKRFRI